MKKIVIFYFIVFALISCKSKTRNTETIKEIQLDSVKPIIQAIDTFVEERFMNFPIPKLDSIFPFFETSGMVANAPSKRFYNPTDSGIFVFYTLFYREIRELNYLHKEEYIGDLTTHTYRKPKYGWSDTDKDQTFILLELEESSVKTKKTIKFGKKIEIGTSIKTLKSELGEPIYIKDSNFVFLGKNKIIGKFDIKNDKVRSITYGHFNLNDSIFELDSVALRKVVEKKLKGLR